MMGYPLMSSSESEIQNKEMSESESDTYDTFAEESCMKSSMNNVLATLSEKELLRYEAFRRVGFKRNMIKRLCFEITGQSCNPKFIIAVCGLAKVFVGELVDKAKEVQQEWGQSGPLLVTHIHEAYRKLRMCIPNMVSSPESPW